jgi:hypothetical protein
MIDGIWKELSRQKVKSWLSVGQGEGRHGTPVTIVGNCRYKPTSKYHII